MTTPQLSVVIPMYNEEEVLPLLAARLRPILDGLAAPYEVVAVDDGSRDHTGEHLLDMAARWRQLRVIRLRRNCGHQAALTAGLHRADGDYVVSIDADLQDPPEKIPEMLALARRDRLDIVYGVRDDRTSDSFFKRRTAGLYYAMMRRLVGSQIPPDAGDFRLLSRAAVDALKQMPERTPVYRLLVPWLGFPSGQVSYRRDPRAAGSTKYPLGKMVRLAFDSVTSFSAAPLRAATWLGLAGFASCLPLVGYGFYRFLTGATVNGWTSLFIALLLLGSIQLLCLGLLGEYLGRLYAEVKGRPRYVIGYDSGQAATADADLRTAAQVGRGGPLRRRPASGRPGRDAGRHR